MINGTDSQFRGGIASLVRSVINFHDRFGLETLPDNYDQVINYLNSRLYLLDEEVEEHRKDCVVLPKVEELVDVLYVVLATLETLPRPLALMALRYIEEKNDAKTPETHYFHPLTGKITRRETENKSEAQ